MQGDCALGCRSSRSPRPGVGRLLSLLFSFFLLVALRGQGRGCPPWCVPRLPSAERVGVEAASVQGKGGCCRGFFAGLPDARGTGTKGWLQGTMVGRLVTVRRRPGTQSSLCLRPAPAAAPRGLRPFVCALPAGPLTPCCPRPTWPAGWAPFRGSVPLGHAGGRARGRLPRQEKPRSGLPAVPGLGGKEAPGPGPPLSVRLWEGLSEEREPSAGLPAPPPGRLRAIAMRGPSVWKQ